MIGTWRWNVGFSLLGAVLTFLFSIANNTFATTLLRCFYAFVVFAAIGFVVRLALGVLLRPSAAAPIIAAEPSGSTLDLTTPEDGELTDLMKEQWTDGRDRPVAGFQPLNPAKLVSLDQAKTGEVVQAIRQLADE